MVGDIVRLIDGPLAPIPCVSKTCYRPCDDCSDEDACAVRGVMQNVQKALSEVLDYCSLARLRDVADPIVHRKLHDS
jgi:DNA-binding IscR family transcriptional regulator